MDSASKTWRVAFIGAGAIIQRGHIPSFQRLPNVETVAICDINAERAGAVATATGIPDVFTEHKKMLADVKPDITVIATPNIFHTPMSLDALEAGSHVLCEKPLALTYEDAKKMMDKAGEKGLVLTVGTHYRWSAPMRACKAHVDAGFFGKIYAVRTVMHRRAGIPGFGSWFTNKDLAGAGSILDIGVHALDRALFLMDYPAPVSVSGALFSEFGTRAQGLGGWGSDIFAPTKDVRFDVDDLAWAFVRFANGAVLQFQVAWATHYPAETCTELFGTEGGARVGDRDGVDLYTTLNGQPVQIENTLAKDDLGSYPRLVEAFVAHLSGDPKAEIITRHQALTGVRIIDAIGRSAASGSEVKFTE